MLDGDPAPPPPRGHSPQFFTHICCGQMAGWIKMPLGREVGFGPSDIVLDGDPVLPPQKGGGALSIFGPCLFWPNSWMDQDGTWHGGRPTPRPHCARRGVGSVGTQLPLQKGGTAPIFGPCLLWPNGWMDLDATWCEGKPRPPPHCVKWGSSSPKMGTAPQSSLAL